MIRYAGGKSNYRGRGRLAGADAAKLAKPIYICNGCGLWHDNGKPAQCISCGRMDFAHFHSTGEAKMWARLEQRQRVGLISQLERQIPFPLYTVDPNGKPVQWAKFVADFVYVENGVRKVFDYKPRAGIGYDAELKIRCLEAQGVKVEIITD